MFEKQLIKLRKSIERAITDFFGTDMTVVKAVDWENDFDTKYSRIYGENYNDISFRDIDVEHRKDFAMHKTLRYFLKTLSKLNELEDTIRGEHD